MTTYNIVDINANDYFRYSCKKNSKKKNCSIIISQLLQLMAIILLMSNVAKLTIIREGYIKGKIRFLLISETLEKKRKKEKILMAGLAK